MKSQTSKAADETLPWATFLETTPPNVRARVSEFAEESVGHWYVTRPDLQLHCASDNCGGIRFFAWTSDRSFAGTGAIQFYATYKCRNCQKTGKIFSVAAQRKGYTDEEAIVMKFGELPEFGPPVPARVITLIGPDRDMFLRGRRAENQGLGIGAFGYYRRVVENQKGRLIAEIAKIAERLAAPPETIEVLVRAQSETQFSKAVDDIKDAVPASLLINGHNPLRLLHNALSKGLHAQSDEECLEMATSIRVVLTELSDRMSVALKDEAELKQAISRLLTRE